MDNTLDITSYLNSGPNPDTRKRQFLVAWLRCGQTMPRLLWDELPQTHQELARIELNNIGLHVVVLDQHVRGVPDARD